MNAQFPGASTGRQSTLPQPQYFPGTPEARAASRKQLATRQAASPAAAKLDFAGLELRILTARGLRVPGKQVLRK